MTPVGKTVRRPIKAPMAEKGKTRTTLCLPESMLESIHRAMDGEGTSRKRRSQWIESAVERLYAIPGAEELVLEEFMDPGGNKTIPVSLSKPVRDRIDRTVADLSREVEKPVESSALLRTAISQYLLRAKKR